MKKKAIIINCFDTYEDRMAQIEKVLEKYYDVHVVLSDFEHYLKKKRTVNKRNVTLIPTKEYNKNLSFQRLYSHYIFSKNAIEFIESMNVDLIYVLLPPNSIAKHVTKYKRRNPNVKVIMDIIDLWPETLPIKKIEDAFFMKPWKNLRDKHLKDSDFVITECDLFEKKLKLKANGVKTNTLYMAKSDINIEPKPVLSNEKFGLVYLGSINNIIDIDKITEIISNIIKFLPVDFHVIGDGEKRRELLRKTSNVGANVIYHGNVYEENEKQIIFDQCHFGLNIMKDSVVVGLTMKSIDYFQHGIPIINNIQYDTSLLVEKYNIGVNINEKNITEEILSFYSKHKNDIQIRNDVLDVYENYFSNDVFQKKLTDILHILKKM